MSPTMRQLAMRLKAARTRTGLTQAALAAKAGLTREYVNKLEAGRHDPTVGTLQRLATVLGVRMTTLLK
jgi:transcriptional regulator with XRE-family HTH domain